MEPASPTIADIARQAGVTKATVSMALRNHPRISKAQCLRIQKMAARMGYQNNALLGQLMHELRRSRRQKYVATLALINVSEEADLRGRISIVDAWLSGAQNRAEELGYGVDHFWLEEPGMDTARLARILQSRGIQGVAFYGMRKPRLVFRGNEQCEEIWSQFPCVTIGSLSKEPALHFVSNDQYSTSLHACERLRELGYSRIGLAVDRWIDQNLEYRFVAGYRACPELDCGIPVLYSESSYTDRDWDREKQMIGEWLERHRPDVCLCNNSFMLDLIRRAGWRIPEDIGLALLDLPEEMRGVAAGMEQRPVSTGRTAVEVLVGQILRRETGVPSIQQGTLIESIWAPGPTVRNVLT